MTRYMTSFGGDSGPLHGADRHLHRASRDTSAFEAFDRMAKKVDQIEAQADAEQEINQLDAGDKALEREFKQLEGRDTSGDKLLDDLKRKMGQIEDKSSEAESQGTSEG